MLDEREDDIVVGVVTTPSVTAHDHPLTERQMPPRGVAACGIDISIISGGVRVHVVVHGRSRRRRMAGSSVLFLSSSSFASTPPRRATTTPTPTTTIIIIK